MPTLILFIILPFLAFILSLSDLRKPENAIVFIGFYTLFGYANHFELETADISRIAYLFQNYDYFFDPVNFLEPYLLGKSADIYKHFIMVLVFPFSHNPKIFCAVIALIYGILSYSVYVKIYEFWKEPYGKFFYLYILVCLSNISLVHLTGLRFFTGALLFILSSFNFIKGNKIWIIGIICVPFIHFSLWIAVGAFCAYLILRLIFRKKMIWKFTLILCYCVSFFNIGSISKGYFNQIEVENQTLSYKAGAYMDSDVSENSQTQTKVSTYRKANGVFTKFFEVVCKTGLLLMLLNLYNKQKQLRQSKNMKNLFTLCYIFSCIAILGIGINYEFRRFICISWCLMLLYFAYIYGRNPRLNIKKYVALIFVSNFYWVCYLFINAPRLVDSILWYMPTPYIIYQGFNFKI